MNNSSERKDVARTEAPTTRKPQVAKEASRTLLARPNDKGSVRGGDMVNVAQTINVHFHINL